MPAPIVLFVYCRPDLTRRTLEALAANRLADRSELIVFSDGPKTVADEVQVEAVRAYVSNVKGFAQVHVLPAPSNRGLARSIISGVTSVMGEYGRAIIMEDDIETSSHFLSFMDDALKRYADVPQVAAISGFHPPFAITVPETFFQRDAECWGWATWQRAWGIFNPNGAELLSELRKRNMLYMFDQDGSYPYVQMLEDQILGKNDSWAVRWRASVILNGMLSLYPGRSLARNIGFDGSGTHSGVAEFWGNEISATRVRVGEIPLLHSSEAFECFRKFNHLNFDSALTARLRRKLGRIIRRLGS